MSAILPLVEQAFTKAFGGAPELVARAPGRVNLIGEHTDYNAGFVLPVAIGIHSLVAARRRADRQVNIIAADYANAVSSFALDQPITASPDQPWSNYVRGILAALLAAGHELPGADLVIAGTIPRGSGLSSSAALSVAVGTVFNGLAGLNLEPTAVAGLAQASECDFVGTLCGIMDQLVSARGQAGHALLIDCRSLACEPIPLPADMGLIIIHSGITRGLVEGAYNQRRAQCEAVAASLGVSALRDADMAMLDIASARLDPLAADRARHVISENARTLAAAAALRANDLAMLGQLMAASHESMRTDFEITLPPIDALVCELQSLIGREGGARMTGGGFGGAVVAVMRQQRVEALVNAITYRTPQGGPPMILVETASAGARIL